MGARWCVVWGFELTVGPLCWDCLLWRVLHTLCWVWTFWGTVWRYQSWLSVWLGAYRMDPLWCFLSLFIGLGLPEFILAPLMVLTLVLSVGRFLSRISISHKVDLGFLVLNEVMLYYLEMTGLSWVTFWARVPFMVIWIPVLVFVPPYMDPWF